MIILNNMRKPSILQILAGFFILFGILYIGFYITKWILYVLALVAPALIVIAAVLNFSTIKNFVRYLWRLIRIKPILGLVLTAIAVIAFPVTATLLFIRAWSQWRGRKYYKEEVTSDGSEFIDYEVVKEEREERHIKYIERNQ